MVPNECHHGNLFTDKEYPNSIFLDQEDLNIRITGVCDIFDTYGEMAQVTGANIQREGSEHAPKDKIKRYQNYKELIASPEVDAVTIAYRENRKVFWDKKNERII